MKKWLHREYHAEDACFVIVQIFNFPLIFVLFKQADVLRMRVLGIVEQWIEGIIRRQQ